MLVLAEEVDLLEVLALVLALDVLLELALAALLVLELADDDPLELPQPAKAVADRASNPARATVTATFLNCFGDFMIPFFHGRDAGQSENAPVLHRYS